MTMQRIAIDRIKCDGHGVCAELLPEMISLDDWGYPIIDGAAVPEHLMQHARRAVASCPLLALRFAPAAARTQRMSSQVTGDPRGRGPARAEESGSPQPR